MRCRIRYNPESIRRMVALVALHTQIATLTAISTFVTCTSTMASGARTTTGSTTIGTTTIPRLCAQLFSFLSFFGRVLLTLNLLKGFHNLPAPPSQHFTDFLNFYGKSNVFFIIQRFCFPQNHK